MRTIALFTVCLAFAANAGAQATAPAPAAPARPATSAAGNEPFGLNLARIQKGLRKSAERQDFDGLNLRYYVSVFAPAPGISLFTKEDNLAFGLAPYGGPTHGEIMRLITPQEHSAPAADLSGLARWFGNKGKK